MRGILSVHMASWQFPTGLEYKSRKEQSKREGAREERCRTEREEGRKGGREGEREGGREGGLPPEWCWTPLR
jgi:hypothetical protein